MKEQIFLLVICMNATHFVIGTTLNCKLDHYARHWPAEYTGLYTCNTINLVVNNVNVSVDGIIGTHIDYNGNKDIRVLDIAYQTCRFMPKNIETFFPNLIGIVINNSNLTSIVAKDLQPHQQLKFVWFSENMIHKIESNLFKYNIGIEYISFWKNPLMHVGPKLLDSLTLLKDVHFTNCRCINMQSIGINIDELKRELAFTCPPSYDMIKESLVGEIDELIDQQLNVRTNFLMSSIDESTMHINNLEYRTSLLEKICCNNEKVGMNCF